MIGIPAVRPMINQYTLVYIGGKKPLELQVIRGNFNCLSELEKLAFKQRSVRQ